jgi:hypothetical protein
MPAIYPLVLNGTSIQELQASDTLNVTSVQLTSGAATLSFPTTSGTFALTSQVPTLGANVGTFLATPNSTNLAAAITDETGSGSLVFNTNPTLIGYRETRVAIATSAIDLSAGNFFTRTISGATTFTVSNVVGSGSVNSFVLELTNAGSAAITWFSGVKWTGGTAPALTASGIDILGFYTHDAGTTWRGMLLSKDNK